MINTKKSLTTFLIILVIISVFSSCFKQEGASQNIITEETSMESAKNETYNSTMEKYQPYFEIFRVYGYIHVDGNVEFYIKYEEATRIALDYLKEIIEYESKDHPVYTWLSEHGYSLDNFFTVEDVVANPDDMLDFLMQFPVTELEVFRFMIDENINNTLKEQNIKHFDESPRSLEIEELRTSSSNE